MTKSLLLEKICKKWPEFSRSEIDQFIESIVNHVSHALESDQKIEIRGFGVFQKRRRKERKTKNPYLGEEVFFESCNVVYFKPSNEIVEIY